MIKETLLKCFFVFVVCVLLTIVAVTGIMKIGDAYVNNFEKTATMLIEAQEEYQAELEQGIKDGYKIYLDGQEVDADKIDISLYSATIDHEKESIFLTQKRASSTKTNDVPMFFPIMLWR